MAVRPAAAAPAVPDPDPGLSEEYLPMFTSIRKCLRHLPITNTRGGVMIEFAFAMPLLITLLLGGTELGRYVLLHQKLDRTAMTVSDLVARVTSVTPSDLDTVLSAADLVMAPFQFADKGVVIISAVKKETPSGSPKVIWQRSGAGSLSITSEVGVKGGNATIGDPDLVDDIQGIVVGETYYEYTPWFIKMIPSSTIHHVAYFRPRLSNEVTCASCP
jgi:TadE-like protein